MSSASHKREATFLPGLKETVEQAAVVTERKIQIY